MKFCISLSMNNSQMRENQALDYTLCDFLLVLDIIIHIQEGDGNRLLVLFHYSLHT